VKKTLLISQESTRSYIMDWKGCWQLERDANYHDRTAFQRAHWRKRYPQ